MQRYNLSYTQLLVGNKLSGKMAGYFVRRMPTELHDYTVDLVKAWAANNFELSVLEIQRIARLEKHLGRRLQPEGRKYVTELFKTINVVDREENLGTEQQKYITRSAIMYIRMWLHFQIFLTLKA